MLGGLREITIFFRFRLYTRGPMFCSEMVFTDSITIHLRRCTFRNRCPYETQCRCSMFCGFIDHFFRTRFRYNRLRNMSSEFFSGPVVLVPISGLYNDGMRFTVLSTIIMIILISYSAARTLLSVYGNFNSRGA